MNSLSNQDWMCMMFALKFAFILVSFVLMGTGVYSILAEAIVPVTGIVYSVYNTIQADHIHPACLLQVIQENEPNLMNR